jgi:glycosyltransferase involved in cell wall biosynthesis
MHITSDEAETPVLSAASKYSEASDMTNNDSSSIGPRVGLNKNRVQDGNFCRLGIMVSVAGTLSETFIDRQIRLIAPDNTVLLTSRIDNNSSQRQLELPILEDPGMVQLTHEPALDKKVIDFLQSHKVSHLLSHFGDNSLKLVELNSRTLKLPIFVHFHGYDASMLLREPRMVEAYRWLGQNVTGVIVVSRQMARKLAHVGIPNSKIILSPYGVEIPESTSTGVAAEPCRFLAVGRLVAKKAPLLLLEAFRQVLDSVPDATLDLIGDGVLKQHVMQQIHCLGLSASVRVHGARDSQFVKRAMLESSVFVQHSITDPFTGDAEGLPNSILEAGACGIPVVSTIHEGIPDSVEDGKTGFLVREYDVESMASKMIHLAQRPSLRSQMGSAAREKITSTYSVDHMITRLRDIIGVPEQTTILSTTPPDRKMTILTTNKNIDTEINRLIDESIKNLKEGDFCSAAKIIEQARASTNKAKDLEYVRALCFISKNETEKAREALRSELRYFPANQPARELLDSLN